jgi:hypothetical protein
MQWNWGKLNQQAHEMFIFVRLSKTKSASSVNNQKGAFLKVFHDHRRPFFDVF